MEENTKTTKNYEEVNGVADFTAKAIEATEPYVLVDFWASWCGPCRILSPIIDEIGGKLKGKLKVVKVNVDDNRELSEQYQIMSIPTTMLFKPKGADGKRDQSVMIGFRPKPVIAQWLQENGVDTAALAS